jgi:predicted TIM-barrel fold metal-dependent hydrolase
MDRFIGLAETHRNLYMDTSGVVRTNMIGNAVRRLGSTRVLWGTDGPASDPDPAPFVRKEFGKIEALGLTTEQKEDILAGTALRLLGEE